MNIDLELYRIFYTVAKYENISKATKELYVSQPAITQRIANLEKQLNVTLFNRKPGGMMLTKEGTILFNYIKESIEIMNNVETKFCNYINKEEENYIRIKSTSLEDNIILSNAIVKFSTKYPDISVNLDNDFKDRALKQLLNREVDVVTLKDDGNLEMKNYEVMISKKLNFCFYTSKEYIKKQKKPIDIYNNAQRYNFILPRKDSIESIQFDKFVEKYELNPKSIYQTESVNIRNYFVLNGLGIAFGFKEYIEKELKSNVFIEIPLKEEFSDCAINWLMITNKKIRSNILKLSDVVNS